MVAHLKVLSKPSDAITRVVGITSGKGGVGKTHTTLTLALALESLGKRVLVIDGDFGLANLNVLLGIVPEFTIEDFFDGGLPLEDVIVHVSPQLSFIPGGSGIVELAELENHERMVIHAELERVASEYDYLLIDTPAGISDTAMFLSAAASEVVVVVTPEPTSLTDAYAVIKVLVRKYQEREISVVINAHGAKDLHEAELVFRSLSRAASEFLNVRLKYLGFIPFDPLVSECVRSQVPVYTRYPSCPASRALRRVAKKIDRDYSARVKGGVQFFFQRLLEAGVGV